MVRFCRRYIHCSIPKADTENPEINTILRYRERSASFRNLPIKKPPDTPGETLIDGNNEGFRVSQLQPPDEDLALKMKTSNVIIEELKQLTPPETFSAIITKVLENNKK